MRVLFVCSTCALILLLPSRLAHGQQPAKPAISFVHLEANGSCGAGGASKMFVENRSTDRKIVANVRTTIRDGAGPYCKGFTSTRAYNLQPGDSEEAGCRGMVHSPGGSCVNESLISVVGATYAN
jgi:hypothetical protein